jgi:G3E family GTPase
MVAAIPSYHHLKKAIFELRKSDEFTSQFDIKFVVTKVNAQNFWLNENRQTYNYLIENCIKGVCNAVIFETSQLVLREELQLMQKVLRAANFEEGILPVHSRYSFDLELLSQILMR